MSKLIETRRRGVPHANPDTIAFARFIQADAPRRFLDMGTGSGYVGIALAMGGAEVEAVDVSLRALALARKNSELNRVRMRVFESDLFENVRGRFDAIGFNAPFSLSRDLFPIAVLKEVLRSIPPVERFFLHRVPERVLRFRAALIQRFIDESSDHLESHGRLYLNLVLPEKRLIEERRDRFDIQFSESESSTRRNLVFARLTRRQ